jgi:hypothetical protein
MSHDDVADPARADAKDELDWAGYREHVTGILAHQTLMPAIEAATEAVERQRVAAYEADGESLRQQIGTHRERLEHVVVDAARRVMTLQPERGQELISHVRARSEVVAEPLPFSVTLVPRVFVDEVLAPVEAAVLHVDGAIRGVQEARSETERTERARASHRTRRNALIRDTVALPVIFVAGAVALAMAYWSSGGLGPFTAGIVTALVSAVVGFLVALSKSWIFDQLSLADGEGAGSLKGGAAEAGQFMWGIGLILYGPAPRPFRYGFEKTVFGWLDHALVVAGPVIGIALCAFALRNLPSLIGLLRKPVHAQVGA